MFCGEEVIWERYMGRVKILLFMEYSLQVFMVVYHL